MPPDWRPWAGLLLFAAGCTKPPVPPGEVVRPVRTMVVVAGNDQTLRTFPGRVEASRRAELAFQVPGLIVQLPAAEGQKVAQGDIIGQLRPDEFQSRLQALRGRLDQSRAALRQLREGERPEERLRREAAVRSAEAKLANARSEYVRNELLLPTRAVTRAEFERSQRDYRVAGEELESARQLAEKATIGREEAIDAQEAEVRSLEAQVVEANLALSDATLKAPFDGVIAQRFVEANQNVRAKQPVVKFQDIDAVEVVVDVPEAVMGALRSADIVRLTAEFTAAPGQAYPVTIREIAQRADPVTQTFAVRTIMKAPADVTLLPGMTATVALAYRRAAILGSRTLVPISAVSQSAAGESLVWLFSKKDTVTPRPVKLGKEGTVTPRPVKLGAAAGDRVEVVSGLQPGDRIVSAGARFLRDGQKVTDLGDALGGGQ